jgi:DNA-binding Lrp family transcriptional regulator
MSKASFDQISLRILDQIQQNSDLSVSDLAEKVGISTSPCWRRLSELRTHGILKRSVAIVDPLALGLSVNVFVQITLDKQNQQAIQSFQDSISKRPEVMECYLMTGESDYLLRIVVEDIAHYKKFVTEYLTTIPYVSTIRSSFALDQIKYTTALPTEHLKSALE